MNEIIETDEHSQELMSIAELGQELTKLHRLFKAKDQDAIMAALERHCGFVVMADSADNIAAAKKHRAAVSKFKTDDDRMAVQRKIKSYPLISYAFTPTAVEKAAAAEWKRLDAEIKHAENAPKVQLNESVEVFECYITGTLAQINALAVEANERGLNFENHGPVPGGKVELSAPMI